MTNNRCPEIVVKVENRQVAKLIYSLSLFLFIIKIDFYVSGAIKVVLAQIQIYFKLRLRDKQF